MDGLTSQTRPAVRWPATSRSRCRWLRAHAQLPGGVADLRWRYTTDPQYQGRGVYVDAVRAWASDATLLFDGTRPGGAAVAVSGHSTQTSSAGQARPVVAGAACQVAWSRTRTTRWLPSTRTSDVAR